jgi:hypothetical protein
MQGIQQNANTPVPQENNPDQDAWSTVAGRTKVKSYLAMAVKPGDQIVLVKGYNDNKVHLEEELTNDVIWQITQHLLDQQLWQT